MRITLGTGVTRAGADETIAGLWTFANVLGLLTDIIGERTAAAGVTVDGLLIKDAGIPEAAVTAHEAALAILESQITDGTILARLAGNESITGNWSFDEAIALFNMLSVDQLATPGSVALRVRVLGDSLRSFIMSGDGKMEWGDGTAALDTNLFRSAAGVLKTDDNFHVGANFVANGAMRTGVQLTSITARQDDFDLGDKTIQGFLLTGAQDITGFAGGVDGTIILIQNRDSTDTLTLKHSDANSLTANRMVLQGNVDRAIPTRGGIILYYDGDLTKWAPLS